MPHNAVLTRRVKAPRTGPKRPTNLRLNAEVLDAAKALGLSVSQA